MINNKLFLASSSASRKQLLEDAKIPFSVISQSANEMACDWGLPLKQLVESIALHKMDHAMIPAGFQEDGICFVLTADTLGIDSQGNIQGKPIDKEDAITKIKSYRQRAITGTAYCLDKKIWRNNKWESEQRILGYARAEYVFDVPDELIERYLSQIPYMQVSGAVMIEGFGNQFLKTIHGSYSAVAGLPMYEVRQALTKLGFFLTYSEEFV